MREQIIWLAGKRHVRILFGTNSIMGTRPWPASNILVGLIWSQFHLITKQLLVLLFGNLSEPL
jgi:hypothetical protein